VRLSELAIITVRVLTVVTVNDVLLMQVELEVTLPSEGRDRTFKVAIKFVAQASLYALEEALDGRSQVVPTDVVQALDVVMRHLPSMK